MIGTTSPALRGVSKVGSSHRGTSGRRVGCRISAADGRSPLPGAASEKDRIVSARVPDRVKRPEAQRRSISLAAPSIETNFAVGLLLRRGDAAATARAACTLL